MHAHSIVLKFDSGLRLETWNLELGTWDLGLENWGLGLGTLNWDLVLGLGTFCGYHIILSQTINYWTIPLL